VVSLILLFFTASGIFEPLEVALNRIWNCPKNRNYFKNQLVSLGLIFACGAPMLVSTTLTALNKEFSRRNLDQADGAGGEYSRPGAVQNRCRSDVDAGAVPDLLAAAELQVPARADGARGDRGGVVVGASEVCEFMDVAVSEGQAAVRVRALLLHGDNYPVGFPGGASGSRGSRMDGAEIADDQ
jgi:hypothetical protein